MDDQGTQHQRHDWIARNAQSQCRDEGGDRGWVVGGFGASDPLYGALAKAFGPAGDAPLQRVAVGGRDGRADARQRAEEAAKRSAAGDGRHHPPQVVQRQLPLAAGASMVSRRVCRLKLLSTNCQFGSSDHTGINYLILKSGPNVPGPLRPDSAGVAAPCSIPRPDVRAWRSEISQAKSAMRDFQPFAAVASQSPLPRVVRGRGRGAAFRCRSKTCADCTH